MHPNQRWPKGPFPEKYRFDAVWRRLANGFDAPALRALLDALEHEGWRPHSGIEDPYFRLLARAPGPPDALELRELRARAVAAGAQLGLVASPDPIDAVLAVGASGPEHGIGSAALVRFLSVLGSFARWELASLGESRLELVLEPRSAEAAMRIAERAIRICPPLARRTAPEVLADAIMQSNVLDLSYV